MIREIFPGETASLINELTEIRRLLSNTVGMRHPLYQKLDFALSSWDLAQLRAAKLAIHRLTRHERRQIMANGEAAWRHVQAG